MVVGCCCVQVTFLLSVDVVCWGWHSVGVGLAKLFGLSWLLGVWDNLFVPFLWTLGNGLMSFRWFVVGV